MQFISIRKLFAAIAITAGVLFTNPCAAAQTMDSCNDLEQRIDHLEKRVSLLEMDGVTYGPIMVSNIHFNHAKHYAIVQPGQTVKCCFHYKLDSSRQEFLSKNHLIVGLKGVAGEVCATHLYGVWDSSGKAHFNLLAPLEEGEYEVRIAYRPGEKCQDALNSWNVLKDEPGSFATIGIIKVREPHKHL